MLSTLTALSLATAIFGAEPAAGVIEADVGPLRNLRGSLRCALFKAADGFPTEAKKALAIQAQAPGGNQVRCRFEGLAPGGYAVSVVHDEDGDGVLATNFLGIPSEGYGASNNKLPAMSPPSFEEARVSLASGETKRLKISLKY